MSSTSGQSSLSVKQCLRALQDTLRDDTGLVLYAPDPVFDNQFVMLSSVGLRYPEAMYGFLTSPSSLQRLADDSSDEKWTIVSEGTAVKLPHVRRLRGT